MQIYPAIDLRDGKCVRLKQGDYAQETIFGADPAAMAQRWVADGATYLHLVDLDGAKQGCPINGKSIRAIKNVTVNEPYFPGHFPHRPVMPGVIIVEALAQAAGILAFFSTTKPTVTDRPIPARFPS